MSEGKWIKPTEGVNVGLKLHNSITGNLEEFIPKNGNNVGWYICGPTVYDSSHLGHARNYVSFDILRRIVSDYFGYNVFFVMNITDIDDKIIIRAHYRHLSSVVSAIEQLSSGNNSYKEVVESNEEFKQAFEKGKELVQFDSKEIAKLQRVHSQLSSLARSLFPKPNPNEEELYKEFEEFSIQEGYLELAKIFEKEFLEDMDRLGVRPADALTRVSEYVPEIIDYITKIIGNGFAYEASGNVYFDIQKFKGEGYEYGKTSNIGDNDKQSELLAEGEGMLAAAEGKRNPNDFALWKRSKEGEPEWESPWGLGRPGWHIECSAMCSDLLGSSVDINCGGVDLKFPHHDNQLAQSEAHFGCKQWVNYFLHSGHLHIAKLKMSKSLKNFITIRESLRHYNARHMRFFFLMHNFADNLDINMVGGGPPKLGGQTGVLNIVSAKLFNIDVSSQLQSLVFDENSIKIEKGVNLKKVFGIEGEGGEESRVQLEISYVCDGIKRLTGWDVNGKTFELEEEVNIKAGGKIMQFEEVVNIDKIFVDFFLNIRALLRELPNVSDVPQKWNKADRALFDELQSSKSKVHIALCDSFNTPVVINVLMNLVNQTYNYIKEFSTSFKQPILIDIVNYISKIFKVFGLIYDDDYGYQWSESKREKVEEDVGEILNAFTSFRDSVRSFARAKKSKEFIEEFCSSTLIPSSSPHPSKPISDLFSRFIEGVKQNADNSQKVLQICDELRDDLILQLGVRFEDDHFLKGKSVWKLDDISATSAERKRKKEEVLSRLLILAEKEAKKRAEEEKKKALDNISPELLFQQSPDHAGKYSSYDEKGIPTHTADGKEISKGLRKKLETIHSKHVTKYKQLKK